MRVLALIAAIAATSLTVRSATPRFFPDDPIWKEPITQDVKNATRYEPDLAYQTLENLFTNPGDKTLNQRAKNLNTVDEVPDGPFYTNRAGRLPLTPALVARASNTGNGIAPGKWTVISAKSDGVTPGFTIRDSQKQLWFLKFDPPGWRGMATGSEIVAAKLFWAVGYHTAEYHIAKLDPANLIIGDGTKFTPPGQMARAMATSDINWLLAHADSDKDGTYRVIASKAVEGKPVGRIEFHGTRPDDPNDIVPHEHHRELRGYFVFAAWLNHVDAKGINSLSALVTENGRTFIRHYLLDFGSALGSAAVRPREGWEGYEPLVETYDEIGKRILSLGFRVPKWRTQQYFESSAIGRLPEEHRDWDPEKWWPHITNAAFRQMRPDDTFWAASKLFEITPAMVDAAVAEGQFGDPKSEAFLADAIMDRRARILQVFLPKVNPIVDPKIVNGQLVFRNLAVDAGVGDPPAGYRALWYTYDNATNLSTLIETTAAPEGPLTAPPLPRSEFIRIDLSATGAPEAWTRPISIYFRLANGAWSLVGLERLP